MPMISEFDILAEYGMRTRAKRGADCRSESKPRNKAKLPFAISAMVVLTVPTLLLLLF